MNDDRFDTIPKEGKGRCTITNEDFSEGNLLFVWKPYVIVPYVTYKDRICANCLFISLRENVPCRHNCSHVYYCSPKCEEEHWNNYHHYECLFLGNIFALENFGFNDEVINYARLVMRILTQRFKDLTSEKSSQMSIHEVWISVSHFNKFTNDKKKEFEFVSKILSQYILIHLLSDHENLIHSFLPESQEAEKVEINQFDQWLREINHTYCSDTIKLIKNLLQKVFILVCIEEVNALFHITFQLEGYTSSPQTYAMGIYPSAAFVNHSCSPNLARFPVQQDHANLRIGDVVYFATRDIKKGEEICYSYLERDYKIYQKEHIDPDELRQSQRKRQEKLEAEFFFRCDCIRCLNESNGKVDLSYMNLIKQMKCRESSCKGWFIPSIHNQMICQACQSL